MAHTCSPLRAVAAGLHLPFTLHNYLASRQWRINCGHKPWKRLCHRRLLRKLGKLPIYSSLWAPALQVNLLEMRNRLGSPDLLAASLLDARLSHVNGPGTSTFPKSHMVTDPWDTLSSRIM